MNIFKTISINFIIILFCLIQVKIVYSKATNPFAHAKITTRTQSESPAFIRFQKSNRIPLSSFFNEYKRVFNLSHENSFKNVLIEKDALGQNHYRYQQYYKGIQIVGAEYILHEEDGLVAIANGTLIHGLELDVIPTISKQSALQAALNSINAKSYMWENKQNDVFLKKITGDPEKTYSPKGILKISSGNQTLLPENCRLVYRFDISTEVPFGRYEIDVDAKNGEIIGKFDKIYTSDVQGTGESLYNGEVDITISDTNFQTITPPVYFHLNDRNAHDVGGKSWWVADSTLGNQGGYADNWYQVLDTDPIYLEGEGHLLTFYHRYSVEEPSNFQNFDGWDGMNVRISIDSGKTWQILTNPIPAYTNNSLYSFGEIHEEGTGIPGWAGQSDNWTQVIFDLSSFSGKTIQIRFAFASDGWYSTASDNPDLYGWQIDEIYITSLTPADTFYINTGVETGITAANNKRQMEIIDGNYRLRESDRGGGIVTFDAQDQTKTYLAVDFVDEDNNFSQLRSYAGVSTHWGAEASFDYYKSIHNRDGYNNDNARTVSFVHYDTSFVNAFWSGDFMAFGDGDGELYGPFVSIDVVGHEYTHGVTQSSANLIYQNESGALNESFSDIFGTAIEFFVEGSNADWLLGEDFRINGPLFRSMEDPNLLKDPDTYLGEYWVPSTDNPNPDNDFGGVHTNSGVQNYWFYLLSEGGRGFNDNGNFYNVIGIGISDAEQIAYRNLNLYLTSQSQYSDAREGSIQAAIDLFGINSKQHKSVVDAWYAVGVGEQLSGLRIADVNINRTFFSSNDDSLKLSVRMYNPDNNNLQLSSTINTATNTAVDSVDLFDDGQNGDSLAGDDIYIMTWQVPTGEEFYSVDLSFRVDSSDVIVSKEVIGFTTIGPVVFEDYKIIYRLGNLILLKLSLRNEGQSATVTGIKAELTPVDTSRIRKVTSATQDTINIVAGQIMETEQTFSILSTGLSDTLAFYVKIYSDGFHFWSDTFSVYVAPTTAVEKFDSKLPKIFALSQNYPNPFNPSTKIKFSLPKPETVKIEVYNILGQKIQTLLNKPMQAGHHEIEFNGQNLSSGVYLYRINAGIWIDTKKMLLVK